MNWRGGEEEAGEGLSCCTTEDFSFGIFDGSQRGRMGASVKTKKSLDSDSGEIQVGTSQSRSYMKEGREGQRKVGGQEAVESERSESGGGGEDQMETGGVRRGRAERESAKQGEHARRPSYSRRLTQIDGPRH